MSRMIYLDTNIWLDYIQQRKGKYLDLQDISLSILNRALSCEFIILVSDIVIFEINKVGDSGFLKDFSHKLKLIRASNNHKRLSKEIKIHYPDNLHVAIAILEGCDMIISNDLDMRSLEVEIPIISSQDL